MRMSEPLQCLGMKDKVDSINAGLSIEWYPPPYACLAPDLHFIDVRVGQDAFAFGDWLHGDNIVLPVIDMATWPQILNDVMELSFEEFLIQRVGLASG